MTERRFPRAVAAAVAALTLTAATTACAGGASGIKEAIATHLAIGTWTCRPGPNDPVYAEGEIAMVYTVRRNGTFSVSDPRPESDDSTGTWEVVDGRLRIETTSTEGDVGGGFLVPGFSEMDTDTTKVSVDLGTTGVLPLKVKFKGPKEFTVIADANNASGAPWTCTKA